MAVTYPVVNGIRYDFSSIDFRVNGKPFPGIKTLNYSHTLEPGTLRGTAAQDIGRTRGAYKVDTCSVELYREDADDLLAWIIASAPIQGQGFTAGYMEIAFDISVAFYEPNQLSVAAVQLDVIKGCRIKKEDSSQSSSGDALTIKYDLSAMYLLRNKKFPISIGQTIGVRF